MRASRLVLFAVAGVGVAGAGPSIANATEVLTFVAKQHVEKQSATRFTFKEVLFAGGKKVGTDDATCTYVTAKGAKQPSGADCTITLHLARGGIVVGVKLRFSTPGGAVRVIGGSKAYAGAAGSGTFKNLPNDDTKIILRLAS